MKYVRTREPNKKEPEPLEYCGTLNMKPKLYHTDKYFFNIKGAFFKLTNKGISIRILNSIFI